MARFYLSRITTDEIRRLREDPRVVRGVARGIRTLALSGEVELDLDRARRDRFAKHVHALGPKAWATVSEVLDGPIGTPVRPGVRLLSPTEVEWVVRQLGTPALPAHAPDDLDAVLAGKTLAQLAADIVALFAAASGDHEHVLVVGRRVPRSYSPRLE